MSLPIIRPALAIAAVFAVAGCSSYGDRYGYGYSRVSYGYGNYYPSSSYYYPSSYYGWYGSYYYPGVGIYVYDRYGKRHRWSDSQRRYWESRRGDRRYERRENWSDYRREWRDDRWDDRRDRRYRRPR